MSFLRSFEDGSLAETGMFGRLGAWHNRLQRNFVWSTPPWANPLGVSNLVRSRSGLVRTTAELHHWLIPRRARFVPNYIKNASWNLLTTPNRASHAMVDSAFRARGIDPYPLLVRPFMAIPGWARGALLEGSGVDELVDELSE